MLNAGLQERLARLGEAVSAIAQCVCLGFVHGLDDGQLTEYHWPGNVRELRNILERASILAEGGLITPEHLAKGAGARSDRADAAARALQQVKSREGPGAEPAAALRPHEEIRPGMTRARG